MYKEIGSDFWLNKNSNLEDKKLSLGFLNFNFSDIAYLSTGRSAISFVLDHLDIPNDKKIALLPPFTCHTVIEPFISAGYKVYFYRINKDLSIDKDSFLYDIKKFKPNVILLHGYFGFDTLNSVKDMISEIRDSGVVIIEDITQTIYSEFKHINADYYICSLRKWTALPDGACAISTSDLFSYKPIKIDQELEESKLNAFHAKYLYMNKDIGKKNVFLKLFHDAEQMLCEQNYIYAMSNISKKIQANLDIDSMRGRRRENYSILNKFLHNSKIIEPVFSELLEEIVPLYFPIYVKCNRKEFQAYLARNDIYAPIVWPKPNQCGGVVDPQVNWIYDHILAIPCDQRYGYDDMNRIIKVVKNYEDKIDKEKGDSLR